MDRSEETTLPSTMLVDGNNIVMRSIKALEGRTRLGSEDTNTGPAFVAINMLSKYVRRYPTDRIAVCWDGGHDERSVIYEGYKSNRGSGQHGPTFDLVKEFLTLANVFHIEVQGIEADDLIGVYWRKPPHGSTFILSGDKDLLQLVSPHGPVVQVRPTGQDGDEVWDSVRVEEHYGCSPHVLPSVMALMGDTSDGIPGVPGVGVKTAVKMLNEFGLDLPMLLEHPPKKVQGHEDEVRRNLKLVDLRDKRYDLPDIPRFMPTDYGSPLWDDLMRWCSEYEMRSITERLVVGTLWG
jgi:DNA polymerase-1